MKLKIESDWPYVIFTDEASVWLNRSGRSAAWVWGDEEIEPAETHGPKVHIWGAISARGTVGLEIFEENLTADIYVDFLEGNIPVMEEMYPEGYIFQQDNDPKHTSIIAKKYIHDNTPMDIEWPAYSPDVSPIENIWGWLKYQVSRDQPKDVNSLKRCITKHWNSITPDFLVPYIESMPNRIRELIAHDGGRIPY